MWDYERKQHYTPLDPTVFRKWYFTYINKWGEKITTWTRGQNFAEAYSLFECPNLHLVKLLGFYREPLTLQGESK